MDDLYFVKLFDIYKGLLTARQREVFSSHYFYDLSLAEIAEPEGTSRQNVYDVIRTVKNKLSEFEANLHVLEMTEKLTVVADGLADRDRETSAIIKDIIGR